MKKQLLILGLLAVASASYGKEVMMVNSAMPIEEVVVVNSAMPIEEDNFFDNFYFKVGMDVEQEYTKTSIAMLGGILSVGETSGTGWFAALEATRNMTEEFELGVGLGYQSHSDGEVTMSVPGVLSRTLKYGYDSIPLYFVGKYNFELIGDFMPYAKGVLGYSFNTNTNFDVGTTFGGGTYEMNVDTESGMYWGAGLGIERNGLALEVMYEVNESKIKAVANSATMSGADFSKADYSRITVGLTFTL